MDIYLIKDSVNAGPYSESEVMARVRDGRYAKTDLAWTEGFAAPVPLIDFLCRPSAQEAAPTKPVITRPTQKEEAYSADDLLAIADNYKNLLRVALCWLVLLFIPMSETLDRICVLVILGFWIRFGWRLSGALRRNRWPWVIWTLIPLGNLYALVRILCTAARTLKANGIPVKFFGADERALARLESNQT